MSAGEGGGGDAAPAPAWDADRFVEEVIYPALNAAEAVEEADPLPWSDRFGLEVVMADGAKFTITVEGPT